jgi:prepilin-type processing-associated H-X9-DG protein
LGYLLANDADVVAFADAYADEIAAAGDFSGDLPTASSYGPEILRLKEGVERFLVTDINDPQQFIDARERIPVMFDWPDNHQAGWGGNVLYLDGHVEFQEYPGEFPMTETAITTLAALAGYVPPTEWRAPYSPYTSAVSPSLGPLCRQNLSQAGMSLMMYMNESHLQSLPVVSSEPGRLMMSDAGLYPVYLGNPEWLVCPGTAEIAPAPFFDDPHFAYLGYLVVNDADVDAFVSAYTAEIADDADFSGDLPVTTSYGNVLYRLRDGVERFLTSDLNDPTDCVPQREVPILFEWPDNHEGLSGGHVMYMDGHVEWQPYPGEFPMTEHAITTLAALANRPANTSWAAPEPVFPDDDPYHQALCEHNMRFLGLSFKTFNGHHDAWFPELSDSAGLMMFEPQGMTPYYLNALERLHCPGSEFACTLPAADDDSYAYLGYVVLSDSDMSAFATAHAAQLSGSGDFSDDLAGTMSYGNTIYRLREGIERTITDESAIDVAQSQIPVLIEWPDNHSDLRGGNVLYMDGHVEWHDYPGEFPMTEATISLLANMAGRPAIE